MKKTTLTIVLVALAIACVPSEPKKYPYMDGPIKIYWEEVSPGKYTGHIGQFKIQIVQLPGGGCYLREIRAGGGFAADTVTMTGMECPE